VVYNHAVDITMPVSLRVYHYFMFLLTCSSTYSKPGLISTSGAIRFIIDALQRSGTLPLIHRSKPKPKLTVQDSRAENGP
jgi:hypothetical protein